MSQHELTARIAYMIYVERGRAHGRHREDWAVAEAIVALCLAFAAALHTAAPAAEEESREAAVFVDPRERALELLQQAVAEVGRAAVARQLGYKSTSTVGRYVRGDRALGDALAARILETLGERAAPKSVRRAA